MHPSFSPSFLFWKIMHLRFVSFHVYKCFVCMCLCAPLLYLVTTEARRLLPGTGAVVRTELGSSSARAGSVPNHQAISLVSCGFVVVLLFKEGFILTCEVSELYFLKNLLVMYFPPKLFRGKAHLPRFKVRGQLWSCSSPLLCGSWGSNSTFTASAFSG